MRLLLKGWYKNRIVLGDDIFVTVIKNIFMYTRIKSSSTPLECCTAALIS